MAARTDTRTKVAIVRRIANQRRLISTNVMNGACRPKKKYDQRRLRASRYQRLNFINLL